MFHPITFSFIFVIPSVTPKNVVEFNKKSFDEAFHSSKAVMVDFNADWCPPCKRLAPKFAEAANLYRSEGPEVIFGSVNVDNEYALSDELEVDFLPTLILFKNQTRIPYKGTFEAEAIVDWIGKKLGPGPPVIRSIDEFKKFFPSDAVMLGLYSNLSAPTAQVFQKYSLYFDEPFVIITDPSVFSLLGAQEGSLVFVQGDYQSLYNGALGVEGLRKFINAETLSTVIQLNERTMGKMIGYDDISTFFIGILPSEKERYKSYTTMLKPITDEFKGKARIITVTASEVNNSQIALLLDPHLQDLNILPTWRIVIGEADSLIAPEAKGTFDLAEIREALTKSMNPAEISGKAIHQLGFKRNLIRALATTYAPWTIGCKKNKERVCDEK